MRERHEPVNLRSRVPSPSVLRYAGPMRLVFRTLLCGLLACAALPAPARAQYAQHGWFEPVYFAADAGAAARQAAGITGGKVLDVQTRISGGRAVYLVKVLMNDGRVKVIQIEGAPAPAHGYR